MVNWNEFTLIAPSLNEEKNIANFIGKVQKISTQLKIIIADDGSKDKTAEIVKKIAFKNNRIEFFDRSSKEVKGITASVIDSLNKTKSKYVIISDCDLQHPPKYIIEIAKQLEMGNDLAIGFREKVTYWPAHRKFISSIAQILAKIKLGKLKVTDPLSGFFGANTEFMRKKIDHNKKRFRLEGYKILFDLLKCCKNQDKIEQFGYVFESRKFGESKLGAKHVLAFLKSLLS